MYADISCKIATPVQTPDETRARQILRDAASLIRTHGHTKFTQRDEKGFCVHGALFVADLGSYGHFLNAHSRAGSIAVDRLTSYLKIPPTFGGRTFAVDWNNAPERTAEEVINALEAAADA